jgi:transposase
MVALEIAALVQRYEETVRRWLVRYPAEGLEVLTDGPCTGVPYKVTHACRDQLLTVVRRRPRSLGLSFPLCTGDPLADNLAERTCIRVRRETVDRLLRVGGIDLNRTQHLIISPDPEHARNKRRSSAPAAP